MRPVSGGNKTSHGFECVRRCEVCERLWFLAGEEGRCHGLEPGDQPGAGNLGDDCAAQERVERVPEERRLGGSDNGVDDSCHRGGRLGVARLGIPSYQSGNERKYRQPSETSGFRGDPRPSPKVLNGGWWEWLATGVLHQSQDSIGERYGAGVAHLDSS
ncbi:hypothetical protein NUM_05750 [Actinocatenispora comari]|uniref:Uncharacterized protein n=1 Tax=Actinocatenispora comari TaxID=2807577 RepID=A0A8J4A6Z3_9ACTN|nr:hypothetical protein NUM_05750 [Actinocatenispora comari]